MSHAPSSRSSRAGLALAALLIGLAGAACDKRPAPDIPPPSPTTTTPTPSPTPPASAASM